MRETIAFIVFAFTFPVPTNVLIIAGLVVAVVIFFGAILLFRNPGKKKGANADAPGWQPQGQQQGMQGGWNQQGMGGPTDNAWGQQQPAGWGAPNSAQQPQQPGGWGAQQPPPAGWGAPNSAQQPQPGGWGSPAQQQPAGWGAPNSAQQPQQPGGWGSPAPAQQQSASSWGNPGSPQQQSTPWSNASPNTPSAGAGVGGNQPAWDATFMPQQPAAQDSWGQPAPMQQGAPAWGTVPGGQAAQNSAPAQQQQAQTAYGGSGSGQSWGQPNQSPQPADPWNMASAQPQSASPQSAWGQPLQSQPSTGGNQGMPGWQQGSQGMGGPSVPGSPGMRQDAAALFGASDNDKTMLRPSGSQGTMGIVRVEEGKEPGRVYEVRKEELSIGRSRESDIFLEDLAVSRLHAKIVSMGNGNYALKDEGSANGTKVNGQLVNKYQTYPLQEGDKIQLGQTVLVFARR